MTESPLEDFLRRQIQATGPMPVGEFMERCVQRYYGGRDPFGREGDFITAPEISQMFGEMIGLWAAVAWQALGEPDPVHLVELGPGRGTLMADLLRAAGTLPGFRQAIKVHLVETSPALRQRQRETLTGIAAAWHDSFAQVPEGPAIVIANELVDALPIEQFVWRSDGWHERQVACRGEGFGFADGPLMSERRMAELGAPEARLGDIFEVNPAGRALAGAIGRRFTRERGAALIIDYGHDATGLGDTLQAVSRHRKVPALGLPGEADLTAHVDFAALAAAAAPAKASAIVSQGHFLNALGIAMRAGKLAEARPERAESIRADCARLIGAEGMGSLFKVLVLSSADLPDLPGVA